MADSILTILRKGGETAREHGMVLGDIGSDLDAFAQPKNRAGEIVGAECLLGAGEAIVNRGLGFGLLLAESESAGGGNLFVVCGTFFVVQQSFVCGGEATHQVLQ